MATDLNDLLYVAAVTSTGSLAQAARKLGVNHATVFRRIVQLEKKLGVRLFERADGRYLPTSAGEEMAVAGAAMEALAQQAQLKVEGRDLRPGGVVRITSTDSLAKAVLNPILARCRAQYPDIKLHLGIDNMMLNLSRREADIAVRPALNPPEHLIGRRIAALAFAVYASPAYLAASQAGDLAAHEWLALGENQERHRSMLWLQKIIPLAQVAYRIDGFGALAQACADGLGLAVLPCFLSDSNPNLRRVLEPLPELASELWVLSHPELRQTARIQAVSQVLQQELASEVDLFEGRRARIEFSV